MERNWLFFLVKHNFISENCGLYYFICSYLPTNYKFVIKSHLLFFFHFIFKLEIPNHEKIEDTRKCTIHNCVYTIGFHLYIDLESGVGVGWRMKYNFTFLLNCQLF